VHRSAQTTTRPINATNMDYHPDCRRPYPLLSSPPRPFLSRLEMEAMAALYLNRLCYYLYYPMSWCSLFSSLLRDPIIHRWRYLHQLIPQLNFQLTLK